MAGPGSAEEQVAVQQLARSLERVLAAGTLLAGGVATALVLPSAVRVGSVGLAGLAVVGVLATVLGIAWLILGRRLPTAIGVVFAVLGFVATMVFSVLAGSHVKGAARDLLLAACALPLGTMLRGFFVRGAGAPPSGRG